MSERMHEADCVAIGDAAPGGPLCAWFALCEHPAAGRRFHPILGYVIICVCCNDWADQRANGAHTRDGDTIRPL